MDELDFGGLVPRDFGQALGRTSHESLYLVQFHIFLVPTTRALFVETKLDGEVELLWLKRTSREEDPFETNLQPFEVLSISRKDHLKQVSQFRRDFLETLTDLLDGNGVVGVFRVENIENQDDPEENARRFLEDFGPK